MAFGAVREKMRATGGGRGEEMLKLKQRLYMVGFKHFLPSFPPFNSMLNPPKDVLKDRSNPLIMTLVLTLFV